MHPEYPATPRPHAVTQATASPRLQRHSATCVGSSHRGTGTRTLLVASAASDNATTAAATMRTRFIGASRLWRGSTTIPESGCAHRTERERNKRVDASFPSRRGPFVRRGDRIGTSDELRVVGLAADDEGKTNRASRFRDGALRGSSPRNTAGRSVKWRSPRGLRGARKLGRRLLRRGTLAPRECKRSPM